MQETEEYSKKIALYALLAVIFAVYFVYSIGLFLRVGIDSDYSNLVLEAADILSGNRFLSDWNLTGITFITTDLLFFMIGTAVAGTTVNAYYIAVILMYVLLVIGALLLLNTKGRGIKLPDAVIFLAAGGFPSVYACDVLRAHTPVPAYLFLAIFCIQKAYPRFNEEKKQNSYLYLGIFTLLMTLACGGDPIILVMGLLPILLVSAYSLIGASKQQKKFSIVIMVLCAVSFLLGSVIEKIFFAGGTANKNTFLGQKNFATLETMGEKTKIYIECLLGMQDASFLGQPLLGLQTFWYLLRVLLIVFTFYIMFRSVKDFIKRHKSDSISAVLSLGFLFMSVLLIVTDIMSNISGARYIGYFPILSGVLVVRFFKFHDVLSSRLVHRRRVKNVSAMMLSAVFIFSSLAPVTFKPAATKQDSLAQFLIQNGLKYGYGKFWNASHVTLSSKEQTAVRAIIYAGDAGMVKFNWFCKNSWYQPEFSNFVVIEDADAQSGDAFGITKENVRKSVGKPANVLTFEGYTIYVYNVDITDRIGK